MKNPVPVAALILFSFLSWPPLSWAGPGTWGLNDVSILMPLESGALENLLAPESAGDRGELLPRSTFDSVPAILPISLQTIYSRLRVVAVRIDPCFPGEGTPRAKCKRQLRLVWQPLRLYSDTQTVSTFDAALHTFYTLDESEFASLLSELLLAREGSESVRQSQPLQVHPVLAKEGLRGRFHAELKRIVLTYAGKTNFTRITFMTNPAANNIWDFGGFEVEGDTLTPITIARVGTKTQRFVNNPFPERDFFTSAMMPEPHGADQLNLLVRRSSVLRPVQDREAITQAVTAAVRIENPKVFHPEIMDCVSCHVAQAARVFAFRRFPELDLGRATASQTYASRHLPLSNTSPHPEITTNLRAFGYFESWPAISQRVIHESCEVAAALNRE